MVITQQAAQSLAALNMPVAAGVCTPREQQDIALPLMIALGMIMFDIFAQGPPQRALTKQDHLGQPGKIIGRLAGEPRKGAAVRLTRSPALSIGSLPRSGISTPG